MPDEADPTLDADLLRRFVAGRDVECPNCKYNLRDLAGDRCPECGLAVALRVQLAEPKLAAMLAGLVALSAGAGFNALLMVYFAIVVVFKGFSPDGDFLYVNLGSLAVEGAALAAWLWYWGRIRRATPMIRWAMVGGCVALTLANILVFSFAIL